VIGIRNPGSSRSAAYLKSGNLVVPLSFPYIDLPKRHEALIERKLPAQQPKEAARRR